MNKPSVDKPSVSKPSVSKPSVSKPGRYLLYALLVLLYALHNDLWLWDEARLWLGLPVGLAYHLAYCGAAALLLGLLVRWAWPAGADADVSGERP